MKTHHPSSTLGRFSWFVGILGLLLLVTASCSGVQKSKPHLLSPKEAKSKIQNTPQLRIIDVRTPEEFQAGHVQGAQLINWYDNSFDQSVAAWSRDQPVLVYCAVGGRSGKAYERLKSLGFKEVYDLQGGFDAWRNDQLPMVK